MRLTVLLDLSVAHEMYEIYYRAVLKVVWKSWGGSLSPFTPSPLSPSSVYHPTAARTKSWGWAPSEPPYFKPCYSVNISYIYTTYRSLDDKLRHGQNNQMDKISIKIKNLRKRKKRKLKSWMSKEVSAKPQCTSYWISFQNNIHHYKASHVMNASLCQYK